MAAELAYRLVRDPQPQSIAAGCAGREGLEQAGQLGLADRLPGVGDLQAQLPLIDPGQHPEGAALMARPGGIEHEVSSTWRTGPAGSGTSSPR